MPIAVLVKKNGRVISKDVFFGDDEKAEAQIKETAKKESDKEFVIFKDPENKAFVEAIIETTPTKDQGEYKKLTKVEDKVDFIAKKLGL